MSVQEITAKSILRKFKKIDSWFVARYGMNLYRGCLHNCTYCDGRAEKYQVEGEFGKDVVVKKNAIDLLERELDPKRKRSPFKRGFIVLGGGVGDSYQSIEKRYQLTREALKLMIRFEHSVHILTKSTLVERDMDLINDLNQKTKVLVSMSFSSMDKTISKKFEPCVPEPGDRLKVLSLLKQKGISTGVFLMPVIPYISDTNEVMEESVAKAKEAGMEYIVFGGMTLKPGRQQDYFLKALKEDFPGLEKQYRTLYAKAGQWGNSTMEYYEQITRLFGKLADSYRIPKRIPLRLFKSALDDSDRVVVLLEQIDYLLKLRNETSPYGYGAYSLSQLKVPISEYKGRLTQLKGIGPVTERLVNEILRTGTCRYYEKLMDLR